MEPIRDLAHRKIYDEIVKGMASVTNNIINPLGIDIKNITITELLCIICKNIFDLHYEIIHRPYIFNEKTGYSIPAAIRLNSPYRADGGAIILNKIYSKSSKLESIFHEYVHLKDDTMPIFPINETTLNYNTIYSKPFIKDTEFQAEIMANILMIHPRKMMDKLTETGYDMNVLLDSYNELDKGTVLRWFTLIDRFPCHFAWITYEKNIHGKIINRIVNDYYYYDHETDPKAFDLISILDNPNSAAAQAVKQEKPINKASNINGTDYYCYAYYDKNLSMEFGGNNISGITTSIYDRLLIIGWRKEVYEFIQMSKLFK
jgi:hypothetical protein